MFEKRTFVESDANQLSVSLGNTYTIELSREFHLESLYIELRGTLAVSSPAVNSANGLWDLIKRVELHIPNGDNTKIVDVKGATLMRMAMNLRGTLGIQSLKSQAVAGSFLFYYPIFCAQPQIQDPVGSRFLLPCPSFSSKPRLVITMAAAATDCGTGLTFSAMTLTVHSQRRFVTRTVEPVRWSLIEREVSIASTGRARAAIELGGSLMGLLLTGYNSGRTAFQAPAAWSTLQSLEVSRSPVRQWLLDQVYLENSFSIFDLASSYGIAAPEAVQYLDFVTDKSGEVVDDVGSVLPTEPTRAAGNEIAYVFDNATANLNLSLTEYRIAESDAFLAKLKRRELNPAAAA
jgi:hypothetical protein